jgi:hypothetical protein
VGVFVTLVPSTVAATRANRKATTPPEIALSMIVEITSETPRATFNHPAMPAPQPPDGHRDQQAHQDVQPPGQVTLTGEDRGCEGRDPVLPLDPDVEQIHPEPDGHRGRGQVEDHGFVEHVGDDAGAWVP